jgi:RNA polymerase sigma factor (TIGR02999 family)
MTSSASPQLTELLLAWGNGDQTALDRLTPLVYRELHQLARRYMAQENPKHTLQPTALVHEAYLRLIDVNRMQWQNRAHFYAVSAQMMRRILVEFARRRGRYKRGGDAQFVTLDPESAGKRRPPGLLALDDALTALEKLDPRKAQIVELRFFGGLGVEETAEVLKISPETVMREWKKAKAWLYSEL